MVLFQTFYVQKNEPEIGRDTVEVLDRNGVSLACVRGLRCCGMPAWEHGDLDTLRRTRARTWTGSAPYVEAGAKVIAICPGETERSRDDCVRSHLLPGGPALVALICAE